MFARVPIPLPDVPGWLAFVADGTGIRCRRPLCVQGAVAR